MASRPLNEQDISLDETMEMPSAGGTGMVAAAALEKLKAYDSEITAFREDLNRLRRPGAGVAELRRLVDEAMQLQGKMNLPPELLSRDVLLQAGIPVEELEQARSILQALSACEKASEQARSHLHGPCEADIVDDLAALLEESSKLRQLASRLQQQKGRSAVAEVDLAMDKRRMASSQLCEALLDKVATATESEPSNTELLGKMKHFYAQDWVKQEFVALSVELPPGWAANGSGASARGCPPLNPEIPSSISAGGSGVGTLADMVASQAHGRSGSPAPAAPNSAYTGSAAPVVDPEFTGNFGSDAMLVGRQDHATGGEAWAAPQYLYHGAPSSVEEGWRAAATEDWKRGAEAFANVSQPSAGSAEWPQHMSPAHQSSNTSAGAPPGGGGQGSSAGRAAEIAARHGTQELWQAVHVGDEAAIKGLIRQGLCNGVMMDASGHTVLWHSIAFSHIGIAKHMLDTFPPGSEGGCDLTEAHPRRGDTLLHLLCQCRPFVAETATLFKSVASAVPRAVLEKENAQGVNFVHIACSALNFWVLKFVCTNLAGASKNLCCHRATPLTAIAESIPTPTVPTCSPAAVPLPEHFQLAQLLGHSSGRIPFADVAFDVGPEDSGGNNPERGRFLAHRVVAGAQSSVLLEALENLEVQDLPQEGIKACVFRVDPRISKEVWRSALQFLYTGAINCPFERDTARMVELLRACTKYKLPKPLMDYAQSIVFQLLSVPQTSPMAAFQVFSVTAGSAEEDFDFRDVRELAAYVTLSRANEVFEQFEPPEVAKVLEKLVQTVEQAVFNPKPKSIPKGALKKSSAENAQSDEARQQQMQQMQMQQWQQYQMQMQAYGYGGQHGGYGAEAGHPSVYQGGSQAFGGNWH